MPAGCSPPRGIHVPPARAREPAGAPREWIGPARGNGRARLSPSLSVSHLGGGSLHGRFRLWARLLRALRRRRLLLAPIPVSPAPVAPPPSALRLLQLGAAPLGMEIVLLEVVLRLRPDGDALVELHHQEAHRLALRALQELRHLGVAGDHQLVLAVLAGGALDLPHDVVRHGLLSAHVSAAVAGRADLGGQAGDALAHALARHLHQADVADLEDVGLRAVCRQRFLESLEDLLPIGAFVHVDEVDDDDAADVAQAELVDDLLGSLAVDLGDGVFQRRARALLADIAARVHVDGDQRLGLVDDDVPAALQPDLAVLGEDQLLLDAVLVEDGLLAAVQLDALLTIGRGLLDEGAHPLELGALVDHQFLHLVREQVADAAQDQIEVRVDAGGGLHRFALLPHLVPETEQELDVRRELLAGLVLRHGADDEPRAGRPVPVDQLAQPAALLLVLDPAGDADVVHRRHEDQVPPGQGDVAGDARALGADGVLHHLDQDLVALLEQVLDLRAALAVAVALLPVASAPILPHPGLSVLLLPALGLRLLARRTWPLAPTAAAAAPRDAAAPSALARSGALIRGEAPGARFRSLCSVGLRLRSHGLRLGLGGGGVGGGPPPGPAARARPA